MQCDTCPYRTACPGDTVVIQTEQRDPQAQLDYVGPPHHCHEAHERVCVGHAERYHEDPRGSVVEQTAAGLALRVAIV